MNKKIIIISIFIAMILSIVIIKPTYADWWGDVWDGMVDWWNEHFGGEEQESVSDLVEVVRILGSDGSTWINLSHVDIRCVVLKLIEGISDAELSRNCLDCKSNVNPANTCQQCIDEHINEWSDAIREIVLEGECSSTSPSAGYDAAASYMRIRPAEPIAGQSFTVEVAVASVSSNQNYFSGWSGYLDQINENGEVTWLENASHVDQLGYEFRGIVLPEGRYTLRFGVSEIYNSDGQLLTDSAPQNNIMEIPLEIYPNPPTNPVALYVTSENPITLSWTRYAESDFHKYEIHRSTVSNFTPTHEPLGGPSGMILDSATTTYVDNSAQPGTRYYYKVKVCDITRECAISNEVSAARVLPELVFLAARIDSIDPNPIRQKTRVNNIEAYWASFQGRDEISEGYYIVDNGYEWDFGDGQVTVGNATPTHAYFEPGNYTVRLRVQDNRGEWSPWASTFLLILGPEEEPAVSPPEPPSPGHPPQITFPTNVITKKPNEYFDLSATVVDPDPGGGIVRYEWDLEGDSVYEWSSPVNSYRPNCVIQQQGVYQAHLRATDVEGLTAVGTLKIIIEMPPPLPHVISASWNPDECKEGEESVFSIRVQNVGTRDLQISDVDIDWWWNPTGNLEYVAEVQHFDANSPGWQTGVVPAGKTKTIYSSTERVSGVGPWRGVITVHTNEGNLHTEAHLIIHPSMPRPEAPPESQTQPQPQPEEQPEAQPQPQAEEQPQVQPEEEVSGADLQLMERTLEFSAPAFKVGKEIKIAVKVKNTGAKKLAPVEVAFWADEEEIGEAKVGGLAPGEKERLVIKWTPRRADTYTIYAVVDPHKRFDEKDEGNNRDSRPITIEE